MWAVETLRPGSANWRSKQQRAPARSRPTACYSMRRLHAHVPFPNIVPGRFVQGGRLTPGKVPLATQLVGRDMLLYTLYNSMVRSNYKCQSLNITGPPGVGKAALATFLAEFAFDRTELNGFRGVYFFDAAEIASTVQRPTSSHGHRGEGPSPLERVVEEMLDIMNVPAAAELSRRGLRHAADKLGSAVRGSLFVITHCDVEGRHGMQASVVQDIATAVEGLLCRLVKAHRCSLIVTSREPMGQAWQLEGHHTEQLTGLAAADAGQHMLVQWQINTQRASSTLTPDEWGTHLPATKLRMVPPRDRRVEYFKLVGNSQLMKALCGNPRAIHQWVLAAKGRTPNQHHQALLLEAGRILQKMELPLQASVLGQEVVDQLESVSPSTPFSPEPAGSGSAGTSTLPLPPLLSGAMSSPAGAGGSSGAHSEQQPAQQQSFVPGGSSPGLGLPVSESDFDLRHNQHEVDAPLLWSAWLSLLRHPQDTPAIALCAPGAGQHETAGGPSLRFVVSEYTQARLPTVLSQRRLQEGDITTMVGWVLAYARSNPTSRMSEVSLETVQAALQNCFIPWLGTMKTKLLSTWPQVVPGSTMPVLQGFLDHNQALHQLQASGAALGTYLWRFSASSCTSITATVLTVGTTRQYVAWNCRLTLTRLPSDAAAYSARGVQCASGTPVWQYDWPKTPGAHFVYELEDFAARHSDMFRNLLIGKNSSTYDDRAVAALLGSPSLSTTAVPSLHHSSSSTVFQHQQSTPIMSNHAGGIPERPTFGMRRVHSDAGGQSPPARPPQFM